MAQADAPPPFLDYSGASRAPHDDHYHNHEHQPQRRRVEHPWHQRPLQQHFLGDGLDFRRPIMSAASMADAIDLTGDRHEHSIPQPRLATPGAHGSAAGTSSRAQRLPRYQRDIIDLADSDEEEQQHRPAQRPVQGQRMNRNPHMPLGADLFMPQMEQDDDDSLFIPEVQARPTTAGLRRVGSLGRRPTPSMDPDDVEIVSSRPLSRNPSRRATPAVFMPGQGATQSPANDANVPIDLTADDDDDVIHTNTRPIPSINGDRPAMAGSGIGTRERPIGNDFGIGRLVQRFRGPNHLAANFLNRYANANFGNDEENIARTHAAQRLARRRADHARAYREEAEERLHRAQQQQQQQQPGGQHARRQRNVAITAVPGIFMEMDYGMVGFDLGIGVVEPPAPKYEPPPPAEKGFTRSPEEDEEVVCPNCGDELAVGKDEMKQQIWVVKSCGHVSVF